jgi:O-antigen ligase
VLTLLLIGYLLRRDLRETPRVATAVWIPTAWLMIIGSRQISQWYLTGPLLSAQALEEGSPVDKTAYAILIVAGVYVLARRRLQVEAIFRRNFPIVIFFLYAGLSVVWSDFPAIALKRWIKALGDLVMVLVLWSDPFPARAITAVIKRCAYVLIPLSVLFCKYYENIGRTIDSWGKSSYTGVTVDKNMFGYLLFAFGLYFVAALMSRLGPQQDSRSRVRSDQLIAILMLVLIGWLLPIANSKTATLALAAGVAVVAALRIRAFRRNFWSFALASIVVLMVAEELLSATSMVLEASGRDATLTGRTGLWGTLLKEPINPIVGTGYTSFWLGERLTKYWTMYPTSPPIQAHNGYLEVYLNLGLIGLFLLIGVLWSGLRTIRNRFASTRRQPDTNYEKTLKTFGLAYGTAYLLYNVTEATFQGMNFLFFIFLILAWRSNGSAR